MGEVTPLRLVLIGIGGVCVLWALGLIQLVLLGEDCARGYLDALAFVACAAIAWRLFR